MAEPAGQKSADAYRTISEVAAELKLPQHVLRFWETRFSQVRPLKRAGGRRFYRPEDVDLLRAVKALLYGDGYTIKGVQRMLREQGPRAVSALAAAAPLAATAPPVVPPPAAGPLEAAREPDAGPQEPAPERATLVAPPAEAPPVASPRAWAPSEAGRSDGAAAGLETLLAEIEDCARLLRAARSATG